MKRNWKKEELEQQWTLFSLERELLKGRTGATRLGFAVLMKFFQVEGRFPENPREVAKEVIRFIADQLELSHKAWREYPWGKRTATYHRDEIREFFSFRKGLKEDSKEIYMLLVSDILNHEHRPDRLQVSVLEWYRNRRIEPPAMEQIRRLIQSALFKHENRFCIKIAGNLNAAVIDGLNNLLELHISDDGEWTTWQTLKSDPGKAGVESIKEAVARFMARQWALAEMFAAVRMALISERLLNRRNSCR